MHMNVCCAYPLLYVYVCILHTYHIKQCICCMYVGHICTCRITDEGSQVHSSEGGNESWDTVNPPVRDVHSCPGNRQPLVLTAHLRDQCRRRATGRTKNLSKLDMVRRKIWTIEVGTSDEHELVLREGYACVLHTACSHACHAQQLFVSTISKGLADSILLAHRQHDDTHMKRVLRTS